MTSSIVHPLLITILPLLTAPHFSMAERLPNSVDFHDPVTSQSQPTFRSATYIVQVPKNQVYRVPPPENAKLLHQNHEPEKPSRYSAQLLCSIIIAFVFIASALAIGLAFSFPKAKNPEIRVQSFVVSNSSQSHPDYDVTLEVHYPNWKSGILYMQGGVSSLFFHEQKMGAGKFPTFNQDGKNSTKIRIVLKGSKIPLPNNIKQSIKSTEPKVKVPFSLKIKVMARVKTSSFEIGNVKLTIRCDFRVDNLAKGTQILSQQCETDH